MKTPTDEIREIRHQLAAKFDNDLHRIVEDLMQQQRESGRTYITLPRRVPEGYVAIPPMSAEQQVATPPPSSAAGS